MVDNVEPVVARTALSAMHRQLEVDAGAALLNWVPNGLASTDGGGLTLNVAAGRAFLDGAIADRDVSTPLSMVNGATNRVFVYIDDILDDGVVYFHIDQDDTPPTEGPSHKIATVTTSGGSITLITDERRTVPELTAGLSLGGALELGGSIISKGNANIDLDPAGTGLVAVNSHLRSFSDGAHDLGRPSGFDWRDIYARTLRLNEDVILSRGAAGRLDLNSGSDLNLVLGDILIAAGRLVDGIDPSDHSARHDAGGSDQLTIDAIAGTGSLRTLGFGTQQAAQGSVFADHDSRHEPGGADPMAVDAPVATGSLRTLGGGALQAKPGDAAPLAHAPSHNVGGGDVLAIDQAAGVASLRTLGLGSTQAAQGSVLANHDARHEPGGADPMAVDEPAATGSLRTLGLGSQQAVQGTVFADHDARHEPGGADPMAVDAAASVGSLRRLGTTSLRAAPGDHAHGSISKSHWIGAQFNRGTIGSPSDIVTENYPGLSCTTPTSTGMLGTWEVPDDWVDDTTIFVDIWYITQGVFNSSNIRSVLEIRVNTDGELASGIDFTTALLHAPGTIALRMERAAMSGITSTIPNAGDIMSIAAFRDGAHASDLYNGNITMIGVKIRYTAEL